MRRLIPLVCLAAVVLATIAGCASVASSHPAARTVEGLLELRRDDVRDPKAYAPYFLESSLATALAQSAAETTEAPRVPEWDRIYVSEETSSGASVAVVWKKDKAFPDWPAVNIFSVELRDDRWVVVDAVEATSAPKPIEKSRQK